MKRTLLGGFAAAVLLLSAACSSSTSGSASAPSSSSSSSSSSTAAMTSSESSSSSTSAADAGSSDSSSSSAAGSGNDSEGADSGSGSSSSSDDTSPTTTKVVDGSLDAQSTTWFSTMCDGLAPLQKLGESMSGSGAPSGANAMSSIGKELSESGKAMTATAQKLASLPAPTVSNGAEFAGTFIKALQTFGGELDTAGQKVATGDTSALTDFSTQADQLSKEINSFKPSAGLEKQIEAIPSCKAAQLSFDDN